MPNDATTSQEETLNHMLVWLDTTIGDPNEYVHLKKAFYSTADPTSQCPLKLIDRDYDEILRTTGPTTVNFEGVTFLLAAFTNAERCVDFLQRNQDKRIFFIVSGQIGRVAVPLIMHKCKNIFTDAVTKEPYLSIYVFCHDIERNMDWMVNYVDYVLPFTFDADLLARMIRDIGNHFVIEGKRFMEANPPNYSAAYNQLTWAKELYERYKTLEKVSLQKEIDEVDALVEKTEEKMKSSSSLDNEE